MKKKSKKAENLTFTGMLARTFPNKAKEVDMTAWKDSALFKASVRAELEEIQGTLGVHKTGVDKDHRYDILVIDGGDSYPTGGAEGEA